MVVFAYGAITRWGAAFQRLRLTTYLVTLLPYGTLLPTTPRAQRGTFKCLNI